ncbi:hypothetical protein M408DRAFT_15275 [Serendipita vermifera MAFF 305830]|uniref:Uncharacterized protein n=1 Tax=Serendipita vermifera MAFF 305830 TaxID=933852 RepID=A0A0C2WXG2_SERVB|nr:hypothetical protein M408DRAFT_15275 [Serendipita vermifera MAFF 305830]
MSSVPNDVKGKGRATETTPLLSNGASTAPTETPHEDTERQQASHPEERQVALRRTLTNVFLGSLTAIILLLVLGALLVYSYVQRARGVEPDQLVKTIIFRGPSSVDVVEIKDGGEVVLDIKGLLGVDTDTILGFGDDDGNEDNVFVSLWKDVGRWGVGLLREVTVEMGDLVAYKAHTGDPLATTHAQQFAVPLTSHPGKPSDSSWLKPISLRVSAQPTQDTDLLQQVVQETWERGLLDLRLELDQVRVKGGNGKGGGWRSMLKVKRNDLATAFRYKVPDLPGLPKPRPPLVKLLQLVSYSLLLEGDDLSLYALATIPNPLEGIKFKVPKIPYEVSLLYPPLQPVPISTGVVAPVLTPPNVSLPITGKIVPLASPDSSIVLSSFLGQFLAGIPPPISIRCPLFPELTIETTFPPPDPLPKILEDVTIKHMSMAVAPGGGMLASGQVWATIALPPGLHIPINVTHVWPDLLLFDGPVNLPPEDEQSRPPLHLPDLPFPNITIPKLPRIKLPHVPGTPEHVPGRHTPTTQDPPPLPDPLPDRAFARIRPTDWVVATTLENCEGPDPVVADDWVLVEKRSEDCAKQPDNPGWKTIVTANVERVPVQVLPGRDKQFRAFVSKVVWSKSGVTAGMQGIAGVKSIVPGLMRGGTDEDAPALELDGLPFEGSVLVGKKGI